MGENCCVPSAGLQTDQSVASGTRSEKPIAACPSCGQNGAKVDAQTVKALLAVSLMQVTENSYLYCRQHDCPVVYYSADGTQRFTTDEMRERVYHKEPQSKDVPVCYCFRHTPGSIEDEIRSTGNSSVVQEITRGTQAGYCACDIRNPKGSCCLGDVRALVKRLTTG